MSYFFVSKKDGSIGLIGDARRANLVHRECPKVFLGSAAAIAELDWGAESFGLGVGAAPSPLFSAGRDLIDGFFQSSVCELGSWFALNHPAAAETYGCRSRYDEERQVDVPIAEGGSSTRSWELCIWGGVGACFSATASSRRPWSTQRVAIARWYRRACSWAGGLPLWPRSSSPSWRPMWTTPTSSASPRAAWGLLCVGCGIALTPYRSATTTSSNRP